MNIAIFTHNFPEDKEDRQNAGYFVYEVASELAKKGNINIFCPHQSKKLLSKIGKIKIFWFKRYTQKKLGSVELKNPIGLLSLIIFFLNGLINLPKFIKTSKPDIVISMWAWPSGFFALVTKIIYKKPYIIWSLGSDINKYAKWPIIGIFFKVVLQKADFLFADGIVLAGEVSKIAGKECLFLPSATKMQLKIKKTKTHKTTTLTFLGRMEPVKGPDIFLDALLSLDKKNIAEYRINFVGDGSLLEKLKNKSRKYKNIKFHGNISDKLKISEILSSSDWVVIPSRNDSVPLVFSESMKAETPVIASNLPDISYLIKKYKVGLLFKTENSKDLTRIISDVHKLSSQIKIFSKNTSKAAKDFSVEESVNKLYNYIQIYEK